MSLCHNIKTEYEHLQTLNKEFVSACEEAGDPRTLSADQLRTLQRLKQKLETAHDVLKEKIFFIIHVPMAKNPYREALLESGIKNIDKDPLSFKRKDTIVNLRETIKQQQEIYRSMGLTAWADNIDTLDLSHLTPEAREVIKQEVKEGAIPIVMPDRETQLNTTADQFRDAFKPTYIRDSEEQQVDDALLEWDHFINLINTKEVIPDKKDVPDHPYISMMKPTQKPDERTTNKTVDEQKEEFVKINKERATNNQSPARILTPHEYGVLQTIASHMARESMPDQPITLNPIDTDIWTRFINVPTFDGDVLEASWGEFDYQLMFDGYHEDDPNLINGFRLAVRVEI